jgi:hypothetical protein
MENNKLQDDVFSLQKQRDEMQTEISELQILVEDLKIRLSQSEAEHKQLKKEEQELLAKMNVRSFALVVKCSTNRVASWFKYATRMSHSFLPFFLAPGLVVQAWSQGFDRTSMEAKMVCNR